METITQILICIVLVILIILAIRYFYLKYKIKHDKIKAGKLEHEILVKKGEVKNDKKVLKDLTDDYAAKLDKYRKFINSK